MKINKTIIIIAIIYNVVNFLMWQHIKTMPNATSMGYLIVYPYFWILVLAFAILITFKNRKKWFQRNLIISTTLGLFFCTPLPFILYNVTSGPASYCASTNFYNENGNTIKFEIWHYYSGTLQVVKYWKANRENCDTCNPILFKRDSTWVYLNRRRDTIRIETYKNDKLISVKN